MLISPTWVGVGDVDPYLFPARGRKRIRYAAKLVISERGLIPTFSPQGDGNVQTIMYCSLPHHKVDPYLFPARGRKPELREARGERKES